MILLLSMFWPGSVANFSDCRMNSVCWTHLSSESRKLLEWALTGCVKLLLSDHMSDFDTVQCCRGCTDGFEALHLSCQLLNKTVILFDYVVKVFDL